MVRSGLVVSGLILASFAPHAATASDSYIPPMAQKAQPYRLVSAARDRQLREMFPTVADDHLQSLFRDPRLILYTDNEMPKAHQDWESGLPGIHSPRYNISANGSEPFGNGNVEFPWGAPAGTHNSRNVQTYKFLWLPQDERGNTLPVAWYHEHASGDSQTGYAWIFPRGTVFGEVLLLSTPQGKSLPFEVRIRIRESDDWSVDAFRPFPTAGDLAERIRELRPQWQEHPSLEKLVRHLEEPRPLPPKLLADNHGTRQVLSQWMAEDELPEVGDDALVEELLTKSTFASVASTTWRKGSNGYMTHAPTTKASFHVVPASYSAGFIDVERKSCMRCHDTANKSVREFDAPRDWYGRIRGSDGIFSFHPFDPSCISYNGFGSGVALRQDMIAAGVLTRYDGTKHPRERYQRLRDR